MEPPARGKRGLEAGAGWAPYWLDRMDEHYEHLRWEVPWLTMPPSAYFRRQCVVSCEPDEAGLADIARRIGEERVVYASDYPHADHMREGSVEGIWHNAELSEGAREAILGGNAARILGLEPPAPKVAP